MTKTIYLKLLGALATATFAITLAILIGDRLSSEALAVLAGAVCGVGAAIPTSLLIFAMTRARQHSQTTQAPQPHYTQPIVMVTPPTIQQPAPVPQPAMWGDAPLQRHFTVVGDAGIGEEE